MKGWFARVLDALEENRPAERRMTPRHPVSHIRANYFVGGGERPFRIADLGLSGAFIESPEQWGIGTLMLILLQVDPPGGGAPLATRAMLSRVARVIPVGFGIEFVFKGKADRLDFHRFLRQHDALVPENSRDQNRTQPTPFQ